MDGQVISRCLRVFFEVPPTGTDYGVHITQGGFTAFEKPIGDPSTFNPDGSFDFNDAPWSLIQTNDPDSILANFHAGIGFGSSANLSIPHWMAEFDLTINSAQNGPQNGLYSPEPAFWSASTGGGNVNDPPISSAIFELNPDGSTTVTPFLVDGAPVLEGSAIAPEPGTVWILGAGGLALLGLWKRKQGQVA